MSQLNDAIADPKIQAEKVYNAQNDAFGVFHYPFLLNLINQSNSKSILDIGTGDGSFLFGLASKTANAQFDAVDFNANLIEKAKSVNQELGLNINFLNTTFGENFSGVHYDMIMARFAVEHITKL